MTTQPTQPEITPVAPLPAAPILLPEFSYSGQTDDGLRISGQVEAPDAASAIQRLFAMRLRITQVDATGNLGQGKPIRGDAFLAFNQQLAQLTKAGLPIEQGLRLIAADLRRGSLARTVNTIAAELESGVPLGEAFEKHRGQFPALYGRLVDAGVRGGNLPGVLLNLGRHLEVQQRLRATLWRTTSYPIMVICGLLVVVGFVGSQVIPQFQSILSDFRLELPLITQVVMFVGRIAPWIAIAAVALTAIGMLTLAILRATGAEKRLSDHILLRLWLVGPVLRFNLIARWVDALCIGVTAGLDLPAAIALAGDATTSPALARDGTALVSALTAGNPLMLAQCRLLPATVPTAIDFASNHHDLPGTLQTLSDLYERQASIRLERIPSILTPLLVIFTASLIGLMIAGILMPMVMVIGGVTSQSLHW